MANNNIEKPKDIPRESVKDKVEIREIVRESHGVVQEAYRHSIAQDPVERIKYLRHP